MKVFLSWSGTQSHKVAIVLREWLPSVIQEIEPYVSSEDIDKGARWSTDIAKELSDSTFGILCVTRNNMNAPWLTFEAGALSKTMEKSFVCPFLFDIKRSEMDGPILQFQSTIFEKDDVKKLVTTLNKACDKDPLPDERLGRAFEVWYPTLEADLGQLRDTEPEGQTGAELEEDPRGPETQAILEEMLELSRINQKLLRQSENRREKELTDVTERLTAVRVRLEELQSRLEEIPMRLERGGTDHPRHSRRVSRGYAMLVDELMHMPGIASNGSYVPVQMVLSLLRDRYPWVYDAGMETIRVLRARGRSGDKQAAVEQFDRIVEISFEHPVLREISEGDPEIRYILHRLREMLEASFAPQR